MLPLPVYILAGGKSSRFGSDKARAVLDGQPLVSRIARQVQPIASRITVVARREGEYDDLGLRTIGDVVPGRGPMGGLLTALRDLRDDEPRLLLLSCDLVRVNPAWVEQLARSPWLKKVSAFKPDEYFQPLLAIYPRDVLDEVARRADSDDRSMQSLLRKIGCTTAPLPADWPARLQANTRDDLSDGE